MSFLDSKEQVIKITLSKHGKKQIAKGLFQPTYYAFLDDDIVYNASRIGISEIQNSASVRIVEKTPKTSFIINSADLNVNKFKIPSAKTKEQGLFQKAFGLSDSGLGEQNAPKFNYICLRNALSSSSTMKTVQSASYQVPQLNFNLNTFMVRDEATEEMKTLFEMSKKFDTPFPELDGSKEQLVNIFPDNSVIKVRKGETIGLLLETNSTQVNETFELRFYLLEKNTEINKNAGKQTKVTTATELNPFGSLDEPNSLAYYLDVRTEEDIEINNAQGFPVASGLYDNLPQIVEDFC